MTAPDVRTAAQTEAERRWPDHMGREDNDAEIWLDFSEDRATFVEHALWGAAYVTPTREQIADALTERADQADETGTTIKLDDARDAVLALLQELAEGESDG